MEKLSRKKEGVPIVFVFNILKNYYREYGIAYHHPIKNHILASGHQAELLPVVNYNYKGSIEVRAKYIQEHLPQVLEKLRAQKCHLLAYSASGLDSRFFISELGGNKYVESLTTIAAPHQGSFLATAYNNNKIQSDQIEPLTRIMGIPQLAFKELNTSNIENFNAVMHNREDVKYYSVSSRKDAEGCSETLKYTQNYIALNKENGFKSDNDGIFAADETKWANHVLTFNADHAELVGIRLNYDCKPIYKRICQVLEA